MGCHVLLYVDVRFCVVYVGLYCCIMTYFDAWYMIRVLMCVMMLSAVVVCCVLLHVYR